MAVDSTQESMQDCDSYSAVALPDEDDSASHCKSPVALSDSMDVYVPLIIQLSLDDQMMMVENNASACSKCIEKELDIEKGKPEIPMINDKTIGNIADGEEQMKQIRYEMGGKYLQLLMNHSLMLPRFFTRDKTAEKVLPRMRKYKRSASFNSRKVALLFSVLSSLGTIILIYLTLRVKQNASASTHAE